MKQSSRFVSGQLVQVRSKAEILATLDRRGQLEGLPFMPEMLEHCGKQFTVFKRAHKTCDPPNGIGGRAMPNAVHLEGLRCDGAAHGGCEARCLMFWKDAWLETVEAPDVSGQTPSNGCTEADVRAGAKAAGTDDASDGPTYVCQSTQVSAATRPLRWWDLRQYVEDYRSGNESLPRILGSLFAYLFHELAMMGFGVGSAVCSAYDAFQRARGGTPYPWRFGQIRTGGRTPSARLDLRPGELVRVKSYESILGTLTEEGINRGMSFDAEMVPFCGKTYRVLARVDKIVNEKTGKMLAMKNDCIILADVACTACYAAYRRFCPRAIYPYWREIWLDRAAVVAADSRVGSAIASASPTVPTDGPAARKTAPPVTHSLRGVPGGSR